MKKLLSICIPTYNSSAALGETIENIILADSFKTTELVEIVVSDNCSTDNTEELCRRYATLYPTKFVYSRNLSNLGDINFAIAVSKGSGTICKLHNCYYHFAPRALDVLVKIVLATNADKPIIFLANGFKSTHDEALVRLATLDAFVDCVSYQMTWIGGFFIWKSDFQTVDDFAQYASKNLSQTEVLLRLVDSRKFSLVINEKISFSKRTWPRGGYNIAEVFGTNYLRLLKHYLQSGALSESAYNLAKRRVLLEHILPSYVSAFHEFGNNRIMPYLSDYQNEDYFHLAIKELESVGKNIS